MSETYGDSHIRDGGVSGFYDEEYKLFQEVQNLSKNYTAKQRELNGR